VGTVADDRNVRGRQAVPSVHYCPVRFRVAIGGTSAATALLAALVVSAAHSTPPGRDGLIAYVSHGSPVNRNYGIALVKPGGGGVRSVTRNYRDKSPAWSPNGSELVFVRGGRLYVIGSDGSEPHRITPLRVKTARQPAWSPDGRRIAFVRGRSIYVMRSDGTAIRRIFERDGTFVDHPSWSPDGRWIALSLTDESDYDSRGSIVVIRSTGGGLRYVTDGRIGDLSSDPPGADANDYEPDWSPDGTRLAFTRIVWFCGSKCDSEQVYSVAVDGSDARWITTGASSSAERPSWSPSGDRITAESAGVAIFAATGKLVRILDPLGTEPVWQPLK
jgi:Tol biopolymer transport system component